MEFCAECSHDKKRLNDGIRRSSSHAWMHVHKTFIFLHWILSSSSSHSFLLLFFLSEEDDDETNNGSGMKVALKKN